MTSGGYRYHPGVLAALARHGIVPRDNCDPERVYELLKTLYTFEIRTLKAQRRAAERLLGPQPLPPYRRQLRALKERYPVLSIPAHHWVERGDGGARVGDPAGRGRNASR